MPALRCKNDGNAAVVRQDYAQAEILYSNGLALLQSSPSPPSTTSVDANLVVVLLSNRSMVRLKIGKLQEALVDAKKCIELDPNFEKGYIRCAAAFESLSQHSRFILVEGLKMIPNSSLLKEALKLALKHDEDLTNFGVSGKKTSTSSSSSSSSSSSNSSVSRSQRAECVPVDVRGATGE